MQLDMYVRDELHQVFNFDLLDAPFNAGHFLYQVVNRSIELMDSVDALPTWALSNHDSPRVASRIGRSSGAGTCNLCIWLFQALLTSLPDKNLGLA
jgi:glycosidase